MPSTVLDTAVTVKTQNKICGYYVGKKTDNNQTYVKCIAYSVLTSDMGKNKLNKEIRLE